MTVSECVGVCAPQIATEGEKNNNSARVKECDVLERALTCHIVFVTFEGNAPVVPGALTLQSGGTVLLLPNNSRHL